MSGFAWERKEQKSGTVKDKFRNIKNNSRNQQFGQLSLIQRTKKRKFGALFIYKRVYQPGLHVSVFNLKKKLKANCGSIALFIWLCHWLLLNLLPKKGWNEHFNSF